jgi:hypothetical protein
MEHRLFDHGSGRAVSTPALFAGVGWNVVWVGGGFGTLLGPEGVGTWGEAFGSCWCLLSGHLLHGSGAFGCWVGVVGVGCGLPVEPLWMLSGVRGRRWCGLFLPVA